MSITEEQKNEVNKVLKYCRDGNSCSDCPYRLDSDCIENLEYLATELYISEHPEIFNDKEV